MPKRRCLALLGRYPRENGGVDEDSASNQMCYSSDEDVDWKPEEKENEYVSDSEESSIWKGVAVESLDISSIIETRNSCITDPGVILQVSNKVGNGKRNNKFNCCPYCGKYKSRMSRHYTDGSCKNSLLSKVIS